MEPSTNDEDDDMRKVTLRAHEERLIIKALLQYRNKLNRERKYDGVSKARHNQMAQQVRDADTLLDKLGGDA